jgi:PadR family transcriptional regulator PadR
MKLIKRIRPHNQNPETTLLLSREEFRAFVENWESELLRGISTLAILEVIDSSGVSGIHGYGILQELKDRTNNMLILEEGNLYPTLRKLKNEGILETEENFEGKRKKIAYRLTDPYGLQVLSHLSGVFASLIESMSSLVKIDVHLQNEFFYCPNCTFRYEKDELKEGQRYCSACGYPISDEIDRLYGGN